MKQAKYDFVMTIKKQFELRTAKNSHYSLRAFARDLEIIPSRLSDILNYKKGLSKESAIKIATQLGLSPNEIELFVLSAESLHARSDKDKKRAAILLQKKLANTKVIQKINANEFEQTNNWYHLTLLELIELKDCKHNLSWFAQKLKLNQTVVKSALERLQSIGWLTVKNKKYKTIHQQSETSFDISTLSIKKFHEELLKKAAHALYFDDVNSREFLNMTMAFNKENINEAKKDIRQFQKDFAEKY